jgi:quercetin dioxygenase-like cupin family protein
MSVVIMNLLLLLRRYSWVSGLLMGAVLGAAGMQALHAQQGIQRVMLFRTDAPPAAVPMEVVLGTAEIPAGSNAGKHLHHGIEVGYVLSGETVMELPGEAPRTMKAGDTYFIPAGVAHDARAIGNGSAKVLAFYLIEKGKPVALPAS